jgi:hypothetical protein
LTKLHYERQARAREERDRVKEIKERGYSKEKGHNDRSISGGANSTRRS